MQHSPFPINESPGVSKSNATEIFMDHEAGTALMGGIGDGILKVYVLVCRIVRAAIVCKHLKHTLSKINTIDE